MVTLGVETSCDETACGLVDGDLRVLANRIHSQADMHASYGGVVPEIAARAHLEKIDPVVRSALDEAGVSLDAVDQVAFTRGPGLLGPLLVGATFARALARTLGKPAAGVNHLEGHLGSAFLQDPTLKPPFLCMVVSGGHTELVRVDPGLVYSLVGRTRDDAAGEAFDKCGKVLGLGYPAGPAIARLAQGGRRNFAPLPKALDSRDNFEFSFSGLKTAMLRYVQTHERNFLEAHLSDICSSLESIIVEILVKKSVNALFNTGMEVLAVVGGVSANLHLRERLQKEAENRGFRVLFPALLYSGDNGAMVAAIAQVKANLEIPQDVVDVLPSLRWA